MTSVANSPTLGHWIALALVAGGSARIGQRLYAVYPLKDETVAVDVVHPVFVGPRGSARPCLSCAAARRSRARSQKAAMASDRGMRPAW